MAITPQHCSQFPAGRLRVLLSPPADTTVDSLDIWGEQVPEERGSREAEEAPDKDASYLPLV